MAGTGIMAGICTSPYPSPYPTKKVGDSPYPYPYLVNAGIPRQNGDEFGQYPWGWVYLPSLYRWHCLRCIGVCYVYYTCVVI